MIRGTTVLYRNLGLLRRCMFCNVLKIMSTEAFREAMSRGYQGQRSIFFQRGIDPLGEEAPVAWGLQVTAAMNSFCAFLPSASSFECWKMRFRCGRSDPGGLQLQRDAMYRRLLGALHLF